MILSAGINTRKEFVPVTNNLFHRYFSYHKKGLLTTHYARSLFYFGINDDYRLYARDISHIRS